jgi:predicted transglutaminase-like cysteine proteinase
MTKSAGYGRKRSLASGALRYIRLVILAPVAILAACAQGAPSEPPSRMSIGQPTSPPIGSVLFCRQHPGECSRELPGVQEAAMTPELWKELRTVQYDVNRQLKPIEAREVAWHYATDGRATCVQYALEKRRRLIESGLPAGALQLATAVVPGGIGHLVLVVDTTEGDWVLDNLRSDISRWEDLPYRWIARQDGASISKWVAVTSRG